MRTIRPLGRACVALGLGLALGAVVATVSAARAHHGRGCGHGAGLLERLERRLAELDVAPETRDEIFAALDASRDERRALRAEARAARRQMWSLLEQESPSLGAVLEQADALGALETEARKARLRALLEIRALLTPEQREELRELRSWRRRSRS